MLQNQRRLFNKIVENDFFETFIFTIIILSAILVGVETFDVESKYINLILVLDYFVTLVFLVEVILKMLNERNPLDYFKNGWNVFDFTIVVFSLIPLPSANYVLLGRLLRIFRILRVIKVFPELKLLISSLFKALPNIFFISLLLFLIMYIYAAMGSFMFSEVNEALWGNIFLSLLTLFKVLAFDDLGSIMDEVMAVHPFAWIYFISYIVLTVFVFLNLFIGSLLSSIEEEIRKEKEEIEEIKDKRLKRINRKMDRIEVKLDKILRKI